VTRGPSNEQSRIQSPEDKSLVQEVILAIDQGTTNTKAVLIDITGRIVSQGSAPLDIFHPQPGWVEQSAADIWSSVLGALAQCIKQAPAHQILAIGLSNQRESVVVWDSTTGEPLAPAITWQCRRTSDQTELLKAAGHESMVLAKTGLPIDPLFPASKIHWLLNSTRTKHTCVGTVDSWLLSNLTAGKCFATDRSNASRTQLLNLKSGHWDDELCSLFKVPKHVLPEVENSKHLFGHSSQVPGLPDGIPITSAIGDSHAALFGHAAFEPGEAKATFGTGSSVMMLTDEFNEPTNGMTTTIAWSIDDQISYALEGNILVSASLFPWVAELMGLEGDVDKLMQLAASVQNSNNVVVVPALTGLGAPHWAPQARGIISGLNFAATPAHVAHAAALSMPLQVVDIFDAMHKQTKSHSKQIYVDGGPTTNRFLMQSLADLLAQPVCISKAPELSALGAGMLAGLQIGFWGSLKEIRSLQRERLVVEPKMPQNDRSALLEMWRSAVSSCIENTNPAAM